METIQYHELLKHPLWQKKRLEIMKRDKWTCMVCNNTEEELHVHHKKYTWNAKPWEYENDQLITLCKFCHGFIEDIKEMVPENVDIFKNISILPIHYNKIVIRFIKIKNDFCILEITDNGDNIFIGINEENKGKIFDFLNLINGKEIHG